MHELDAGHSAPRAVALAVAVGGLAGLLLAGCGSTRATSAFSAAAPPPSASPVPAPAVPAHVLGHQPPPISPASPGPLTYLTHLARPRASPALSPSFTPAAACATSRLKITMIRTAGAVLGNEGGYLRFVNEGPAPCQLHGWPTVTAITATGKTVPVTRAMHGTMLGAWQYAPPLPVLRLKPGAAAYAVVDASDVSPNPRARCPDFRWLRVTPPGGPGYVILSAHLFERVYLPDCGGAEVTAIVPMHDLAH